MKIATLKSPVTSVRRLFKRAGINAFIITSPQNVTYLSGFLGDDSWALLTPRTIYLLTDSRYSQQAKLECPAVKIIERTKSMAGTIADILKKQKAPSVGIEDSSSIAQLKLLRKTLKTKIKTTSNLIEPLRAIKEELQIRAIKKAGQIANLALSKSKKSFRPGITESHLAGIIDLNIRAAGATNSFETIVAFGANAAMAHYLPANRKLKKNDTILIDFGAKYKGYCSDITRCFTVGKSTSLYKKAYQAVKEAQLAAIKIVKPGAKIADIDAAARKVIKAADLPEYGHGTGHGIGLEVHEAPVISARSKETLKPGMVFTIEPGIYIPGKLGIRIEDDILVTNKGCKILTQS